MEYEPKHFFKGLEARIWVRSRIRLRSKSRIRIRIKIKNKIRIRIRIRVISRIRIRIRIRIKVMLINNTVSNRHDFGLESDIVALPIDTGPQSPWQGFNHVLNVLGFLHYFTAFLHFCKPAQPKCSS
jgi:hypothetical protein